MRSRTLVTVFAAAGTIADTNIQVAPERKQPTEPSIGRWTAPNLSARPNSAFHTPSARRADFQIARRDSWRRGSRRTRISRRQDDGDDTGDEEEDNTGDEEDEDEDDDGDDDDGDDDDTDDEDDEENSKKKSNAGVSK
ncbi:hypothetical protein NPX13_g8501 [Xylaria arbuscula]|uniref:Uncharacterized protein n=1 Tax=Xylaria arbuscula TaxID=114810 RepID=A0A9W8N8L5_9PEZI|nr:hypothetical protein NPX13_g8501 [Xylaria arbuscula]